MTSFTDLSLIISLQGVTAYVIFVSLVNRTEARPIWKIHGNSSLSNSLIDGFTIPNINSHRQSVRGKDGYIGKIYYQ